MSVFVFCRGNPVFPRTKQHKANYPRSNAGKNIFTTPVVFDSNFDVFPERGEAARVEKHVAKRASKERTASEGQVGLKSTGTQMEPPLPSMDLD